MKGLLISAPSRSSGKTSVSIGLAAAWTRQNRTVQCYKKGPDYIDPMWLGRASGRPCRNLDFYISSHEEIENTFADHAAGAELAVVEGNMGLYDGLDPEGADSNAALAELLGLPVVLVVDGRGMTRGIAPLIMGYQKFGEGLNIAGVILNQVRGARHEGKLRAALENYTDIPVLGTIGHHDKIAIAERHLGLIPPNEAANADDRIAALADIVAGDVDIDRIADEVAATVTLEPGGKPAGGGSAVAGGRVTIAYARDAAFGFYYPDDLQALADAGAELVAFDTLNDDALPPASGLFIGGGFPEMLAARLSANSAMRESIRAALENGMPAYAECGGLMYLSRSLSHLGQCHPMVGFVPGDAVMHENSVGRGYVQLAGTGAMPWPGFAAAKTVIPAHEFHHSSLENLPDNQRYAYEVRRGHGIDGRHDGLIVGNLVAGFAHHRQTAQNRWADGFVAFVRAHTTTGN